jgi:predicted Zn-dependent peptidase
MLNSALRIKSGLTYGASSNFEELRSDGPFSISTYTRNETTEKAIDMALDVLKQLHDKGLTEEQLISAKEYIKGQTPQQLETFEQLGRRIAEIEFYGLDRHDVDDYFAHIDATSLSDTKKIIDKYYPLNDLVLVVIGKGSEIGSIMKKYADHVDQASISDKGFWKAH